MFDKLEQETSFWRLLTKYRGNISGKKCIVPQHEKMSRPVEEHRTTNLKNRSSKCLSSLENELVDFYVRKSEATTEKQVEFFPNELTSSQNLIDVAHSASAHPERLSWSHAPTFQICAINPWLVGEKNFQLQYRNWMIFNNQISLVCSLCLPSYASVLHGKKG